MTIQKENVKTYTNHARIKRYKNRKRLCIEEQNKELVTVIFNKVRHEFNL